MSDRTILVPVDGSEHAIEGLSYAAAEFPEADLVVLHVVALGEPMDDDRLATFSDLEAWIDEKRDQAAQLVEEAVDRVSIADQDLRTDIRIGRPANTIISYATENDIDQIIMGSRGQTDDPETTLGSVAESVMHESDVLVSVVR